MPTATCATSMACVSRVRRWSSSGATKTWHLPARRRNAVECWIRSRSRSKHVRHGSGSSGTARDPAPTARAAPGASSDRSSDSRSSRATNPCGASPTAAARCAVTRDAPGSSDMGPSWRSGVTTVPGAIRRGGRRRLEQDAVPSAVAAALAGAFTYEPIVHIELGPLNISPHGVGIAVGFLLGARLMLPEAERKGISEDAVYTVLIRAAIGSLIGARVAYVINHFGDYTDDLLGIFKVWEGGISLLGGIFGAIIFALPVARRLRVDAWKMLDAAAPGIALGILVGRIGDMIVADHLGKPTSFFLGYDCRPGYETASPCLGEIVHQPHLYDLFFVTLLLGLLLWLRKRSHERPFYDGFQILVF